MAPDLIEGAHYSVMFYGGALLSHLSANDQETNDLIELLRINRNLAIVIDSDRKTATATLNETKQRIIRELEVIKAYAWVTDGYTVENYVPQAILEKALIQAHPESIYPLQDDNYKSPVGSPFPGSETKPSKVKVARAVADQKAPITEWDASLISHVERLVTNIRNANGISV